MTEMQARQFAAEWIAAWNAHDLPKIMQHYENELVFKSPIVTKVAGIPSGTINNRTALSAYFNRALQLYPDLNFTLLDVFTGQNTIVLTYQSIDKATAAEYMEFNENGKVHLVSAHYTPPFN